MFGDTYSIKLFFLNWGNGAQFSEEQREKKVGVCEETEDTTSWSSEWCTHSRTGSLLMSSPYRGNSFDGYLYLVTTGDSEIW